MSKKENVDLSIVVPALNEEKRLGRTLNALSELLNTDETLNKLNVEVVVVSADCRDRTHEVALGSAGLFNNYSFLKAGPVLGKGNDVRHGVLNASGKAILFMDADMATPLHHIVPFYKAFLDGSDIVIGTRNLRKHHKNLLRRSIANGGNLLFRFAGGFWVEDSQCGFKLFSRRAAKICFSKLRIVGWGFDMEILAIASANKLKVSTQRINDWQHQPDGSFDANRMKNYIISLRDLMYIAGRRVSRSYLSVATEEESESV